jgi:hypothetical protein
MWWAKRGTPITWRALLEWWRTRFTRLMIPVWATLAVWWPLVTIVRPSIRPSWRVVLETLLGYEPWVGTGWFITLILELVVLFPFVRWAVERVGAATCMVVSAAVLLASHAYVFHVVELMRHLVNGNGHTVFFYFWIFPLPWLFPIVAGIALAKNQLRVEPRAAWLSAAVVVACTIIHELPATPLPYSNAVFALGTPPLTFLLLATMPIVGRWPRVARFLGWCGVSSWGLYLGQLLVHNAFTSFGYLLYRSSTPVRWAYFLSLLIGAIALVGIGNVLRASVASLLPRMSPSR